LDALARDTRAHGAKILGAAVVVGDPHVEASVENLDALQGAGADVLEVIVPFSDPAYHGLEIQRACARARKEGVTFEDVLGVCAATRARHERPMVVTTYFNMLLSNGLESTLDALGEVGVDGLSLPDVPWTESAPIRELLEARQMRFVPALAPTSPPGRLAEIEAAGCPLVVWTGHLGAGLVGEGALMAELAAASARATSACVIGSMQVSDEASAHAVASRCQGVLVGSAIAWIIEGRGKDLPARLAAFAGGLRAALDA
jgi:tryptophan synthase alpha chain